MNQNDFSLALLATESVSTVQSQAWPQSIPADNMSGFSALPGGAAGSKGFSSLASMAYFWFPEEDSEKVARIVRLTESDYYHTASSQAFMGKHNYLSVRCVRDLDD